MERKIEMDLETLTKLAMGILESYKIGNLRKMPSNEIDDYEISDGSGYVTLMEFLTDFTEVILNAIEESSDELFEEDGINFCPYCGKSLSGIKEE